MNKITNEQLLKARQKTLENAKELLEEAEILYRSGHWSRVVFLSHILREEIGKNIILSSLFLQQLAGDKINWSKYWKRLTSHVEKSFMSSWIENIFLTIHIPKDYKTYLIKLETEIKTQEILKQKSLYCDFTNGIAQSPNDIITRKMASDSLKKARRQYILFTTLENEFNIKDNMRKLTKEKIAKLKNS